MKREPIVDSASLQSSTLKTEASGHGEFSNPPLRFEGWALLGGCSPPNINRSLFNPKHQGEIVEILKNLRGIVNYDDNKSRGEGLVGYGKKREKLALQNIVEERRHGSRLYSFRRGS
ncbi:hypothetical protein DY000_02047959 [Brassica cretica]|uniref:Uncharacterized protein n=1 Tax=Brassica cretica TaxID=69181 RepID=A0ABQ7F2D8_BRACR|nr:hypothetical protein DY000_02047959 [Brassica cretica]